ncbi:MAG: elongation factor 1-beta [Nanoarchaeota archaeon]|nr:elongation factor 1-beta [Nanoarchaeota archaeon]
MAQVVITLKLMPDGPESNLDEIKKEAESKIKSFAGEGEVRFEEEPIGFGLVAIKVLFVMDESNEELSGLEEDLKNLDGVNSVEVEDMRRALG